MKVIWMLLVGAIYCCMFCSFASGVQWADEKIQMINGFSENPTCDEIVMLCKLAGVEPRNSEASVVVKRAFERLSAISEYDRVISDCLRDEKLKWKAGGEESDYSSKRYQILQSLGRIPDPRSVRLLGETLTDMEWTRDPVEHLMSGADYSITEPNGMLAAESLGGLINNPPLDKKPGNYIEQDIPLWREWYQEVKSGIRAFSFKGTNIEYRFKPDGTWTATAMTGSPKDDPRHSKVEFRERRRPTEESRTTGESGSPSLTGLPWILGGVIAIIACVFAWFLRRH